MLTLNPRSGGLEQLVTNRNSLRFSSSVKLSTTSQKILMTGWVAEYPPGKTKHVAVNAPIDPNRLRPPAGTMSHPSS